MGEKFERKNGTKKENPLYDEIEFKSIDITDEELDKYISEFVLNEENLDFMFKKVEGNNYRSHLNFFIPDDEYKNLEEYVKKALGDNNSFYSFLSEGLLGIVYNDILGFETAHALINISSTLTDTASGVDGCLYSKENNILALCEAKFHKEYSKASITIKKDFEGKISNKIGSFLRKIRTGEDTKVILNILTNEKAESVKREDLLGLNLYFLGFVLHKKNKTGKYKYESKISIEKMKENFDKEKLVLNNKKYGMYTVILFHLGIESKEGLICKIISKAEELLKNGK